MHNHGAGAIGGTGAMLGDEQGMALIIVLMVLLLLTILGTTLLTSSTSDLRIAGNERNSLDAFYAADSALEYGMTTGTIFESINGNTTVWPASGGGTGSNKDYNTVTIPGTNSTAQVKVQLIATGSVPAGSGTQEDSGLNGTSFKANYFLVNAIGDDQNNKATVQVETEVAKIVPQ